MQNPIIKKCQELFEAGYSVSSVTATETSVGNWEIRFSMNNFYPLGEGKNNIPKNLPSGVTVGGWERVPDEEILLKGSREGINALMLEVAKVGKAEDIAIFEDHPESPYGAMRILTKPNLWFQG